MQQMQWNDEYATGIPEIDKQHRTLLEFITEFEDAFAGKMHWNAVQPLVVRARDFLKFHFAVEESLMQIVGYPELDGHRAEHLYVVDQFTLLENRVLRQDMRDELMPMMSVWLFNHIIESDKPFGHYVQDYLRAARAA
jgi:hemerythrin